ncbi:tetratricopeptide repeat protein [Candidatus Eisenbacteria bacterium]|uniref:Tetratricopeptide repeat protein n=1 Tax=Eiseniibacteriota bacterium TaxID=2212470 RepID=A0ABV6YNJ9_UNCEI
MVILALALVLRLIHLYQIRDNPFFLHPIVDAWDYHNDALRMIRTGDWMGDRAFFQAPLATYFLAVIYKIAGVNLLWPRIAHVIMGSLTAAGMFMLARKLFNEKAAWIAGLLTAFYPLFIFFEGELLAPTITLFLDVAFLLLLFGITKEKSVWRWILPGLILGLRALATTNILAVVPVFWIWLILRGRNWRWPSGRVASAVIIFTVGIVLVVAPVTIRNRRLQDDFVLVSSNAGLNFYLGNSGDYTEKIAIRPGADFDELIEKHVRSGRRVGPEMSGYFFAEARRYTAANPAEYARLLLYKTYLLFRGEEIMRNQEIYPFREYSGVLRLLLWKVRLPGGGGLAFPFGLLLPLAWPGCLLAFRKRKGSALLLLAYGAVYSATVIAFFITSRYRLPVVLPMILILAYGWSGIRDWWRPPRVRVTALAGMVLLLVLSNWNPDPMQREMNPDAYYSLAGTLAEQGDLEGAESYYTRALEMNPGDASAWVGLGLRVYQEKGMLARAESCYRKAIEVRPDYAGAFYNLGYLAELKNMPAQAESLYLEAIRRNPIMDAPYVNIAVLALSRADFGRAHQYYLEAYGINPENPRTLVGLGVTTFQREGFDPAMEYFNRAIKLDPEFPDIYFNLALVYARSGRPLEAADHARHTLELDPMDNDAYIIYASQMLAARRRSDAGRFLEAAIREHPDLPGPRQALESLR